jgi:hypothetical protein
MAARDRARSDLYLAQLRSQSAPNTPRYGPLSPREGGWQAPPGHPDYKDPHSAAEEGEGGIQYAVADPQAGIASPKPFALQAPPRSTTTPRLDQQGFESVPLRSNTVSPPAPPLSPVAAETQQEHMHAAPGEQQYAAVPIPGSYAPQSPGFAPPPSAGPTQTGFDFGLNHDRR